MITFFFGPENEKKMTINFIWLILFLSGKNLTTCIVEAIFFKESWIKCWQRPWYLLCGNTFMNLEQERSTGEKYGREVQERSTGEKYGREVWERSTGCDNTTNHDNWTILLFIKMMDKSTIQTTTTQTKNMNKNGDSASKYVRLLVYSGTKKCQVLFECKNKST